MTAMSLAELLEALAQRDAALYVQGGVLKYRGPKRPPNDPLRGVIAAHRDELVRQLTPAPSEPPPSSNVNRGVLMTLGSAYGYPCIQLTPAIAIPAGHVNWRAFTRSARADMLWLAVRAARSTWPAEPMIRDLLYAAPAEKPLRPTPLAHSLPHLSGKSSLPGTRAHQAASFGWTSQPGSTGVAGLYRSQPGVQLDSTP
jgi:hypothetical protein